MLPELRSELGSEREGARCVRGARTSHRAGGRLYERRRVLGAHSAATLAGEALNLGDRELFGRLEIRPQHLRRRTEQAEAVQRTELLGLAGAGEATAAAELRGE